MLGVFKYLGTSCIRDAFKKKKKIYDKCHIRGGGPDVKMSFIYKLCLKSILSYSQSFETHIFLGENWLGTPILSRFQEF